MDDQGKFERRESERKHRQELDKLEARINLTLERLGDEVDELNQFLRGGPNNQDPLGTRVHLVESGLTEIKVIVKGDSLGRGSLIDLVKSADEKALQAKNIAEATQKILEGQLQHTTTRRGQNITVVCSVLSVIGMIAVGIMANFDRIQKANERKENPVEWAERLQGEIEALKKERGPEVQKKLKEIEKSMRRRNY